MEADTTAAEAKGRSPWANVRTARAFLSSLVAGPPVASSEFSGIDLDQLAGWLVESGLSAMTYRRYKDSWPELSELVRGDTFLVASGNSLHMNRLATVAGVLSEREIPYVLLKGMALSHTVYEDHVRPMSDVDLWLRQEDIPVAAQALVDAGLRLVAKQERPIELQMLSDGELRFLTEDGGLIEVHWSPYAGWWLQRTANVDNEGMWQRIEPLRLWEPAAGEQIAAAADDRKELAHCLSPEDTVLHLAVHAAVNHQFGMWGIRSIVDVSTVISRCDLDWQRLVIQAHRWRLATALWVVLRLEQLLVGGEDLDVVLTALQPPRWKRALLERAIGPQFLLEQRSLGRNPRRFVLLLLLTDRLWDAARLVWRTLWPERAWLDARYGQEDVGHVQHLWNVLRHRTV